MAAVSTTNINGDGSIVMAVWNLTTADPTGDALSWADWADRSVTFTGTWGGATAALEGSNDGSTWIPLADPQGTAITRTSNGIEAVLELTRYVRARLSTVGAGATIAATIMMRNSNVRK